MNNNIYIQYSRKSSEQKEKQALSIDAQNEECEKIAKREGLFVKYKLEESHTAFKPDQRLVFSKALELIKTGKANAFLTWVPDRLCRNPKEGGDLLQMLQDGVLKEIMCSGGEKYTQDSDHLILHIHFGMANQYSRNLSKNVKRGNRYKFHNKRDWLGPAKPGYLNYYDEVRKEKTIITDEERFNKLQKAMRLILSGENTPMEALHMLNKEWTYKTRKTEKQGDKPLAKSAWYRILSDPYYFGKMVRSEGEVTGNQETMITEKEFEKLQVILGRKGRPHICKHDFPYKSVLKCAYCGGSVTCEEKWHIKCSKCKYKFQKNKTDDFCPKCKTPIEEMKNPWMNKYVLYSCVNGKKMLCKQRSINIKEIEAKIDDELKKFEITEHLKSWAVEYLNEINTHETSDREKIRSDLESARDDCIKKLDNLVRLKLSLDDNGNTRITDNEYDTQRKLITSEKESIERELKQVDKRINRWHELAVQTFNFACYARYNFANGDLKTKTQILGALGSNLVIKDKKLLIDGHKMYFLIEKGKKEVESLAKKFEPAKYLELMGNLDAHAPLRQAWLPDRDSNPN